jgi:hypothetical protein
MKLKLSTPKTPATTEGRKKEPKAAKRKPTSTKKSGKGSGSDEGEAAETPKEEKPLNPQEAQQKKEKEGKIFIIQILHFQLTYLVLYLRHKLQKGLLTRDQIPKEEEMASMSEYIQKLERYPDLEVSTIRTTKINKVLKAIIKLPTIPRDEELNIRSRSVELLGKWNILLSASEAVPSEGAGEKEEKDEPTTNGVHKDDGEDASEKADASADVDMDKKSEENVEAPKGAEPAEVKSEKPKDTETMDASTDAAKNTEVPPSAAAVLEKKEIQEGEISEAPVATVQPAAEIAEATA